MSRLPKKLVRDNIPLILEQNNIKYQVKSLSDKEYKQALKLKLLEESQEVFEANDHNLLEEIADVYEVIDALINAYNLDTTKINQVKEEKAKLKGKFAQKILLIKDNSSGNNAEIINKKESEILRQGEEYLKENVLPCSHLLDKDSNLLAEKFTSFSQVNPHFLYLRLTSPWGGINFSNGAFYSWQIMMAKYSGAFSFLQTQHQSAIALLVKSKNELVKEKYLTLAKGKNWFCGVGFSHLRKEGKPLVTATPQKGGYLLNGFIPWITGYGIFNHFIIGATLPHGDELYGILPFQSSSSLRFSQPLSLCAMNSTNTVTGEINQLFLPSDEILTINPRGSLQIRDQENVLHHGFFPLGCSQASLEIIYRNYQSFKLPEIEKTYQDLCQQEQNLRGGMLEMIVGNSNDFPRKLQLRVEAINLAYRCAIIAVLTSKGKANMEDDQANRVYREALVYGVSGQTLDVLRCTIFSIATTNL